MDDPLTLIAIVAVYALAVATVFAGLIWAEVLDGRDDQPALPPA